MNTNGAVLVGELESISPNHQILGETFYKGFLKSKRLSGTVDEIPLVISGYLHPEEFAGKRVKILGEVRTSNQQRNDKRTLFVHVFVHNIENCDEEDQNTVWVDGYICRIPEYRHTPKGCEICDVMLAVNRNHKKTSYVPCILWGRGAWHAGGMSMGTRLQVTGRFQSRTYQKQTSEGIEYRTAYEISTMRFEEIERE